MKVLTDSEKRIYKELAFLKSGSIGKIAQLTGMHRQSVRIIIKSLLKKGLIKELMNKNKFIYYPIKFNKDPALKELEKLENELERLEKSYKDTKNTQTINILKGRYGLRSMLLDEIIKGEEIRVFSYSKARNRFLDEYLENDKRRLKQNIRLRIISNEKRLKVPLSKIKINNKKGLVDMFIYSDKITILIDDFDLTIITLKIKEINKLFCEMFENEWDNS